MQLVQPVLIMSLAFVIGCDEPAADKSVPLSNNQKQNAKGGQKARSSLQVTEEFRFKHTPETFLVDDELREGWIQLFDGQTLFGWSSSNDSINWHVNDSGEIQASEGTIGLLTTTVPFADYEFRCDYWMSEGGNSGIFLRTTPDPKSPVEGCYELNICDSHPEFKTASLVGRAQPTKEVTGEETWKTMHVRAEGNRILVSVDGEEVLDHVDESENVVLNGLIGLQKNEGLIRFRNVFLRPLGGNSLFNGESLDGWHPVAGSKSEFLAEDGTVSVKNGPGFLETDNAWADFILQFEARLNGEGLNSGVFFRLQPGTESAPSNGYEMQLENVFLDGDRAKPKDDAGTGAIFRRTQARWVVGDDRQWLSATLIAHGNRIATWVNGIQVSDWADPREPHENPRKGRKIAAGPISLQGHDEGTDVSFRNLRIIGVAQEE